MENPRPEKVAVVDEVRAKFEAADAAVVIHDVGNAHAQRIEVRKGLAQGLKQGRVRDQLFVVLPQRPQIQVERTFDIGKQGAVTFALKDGPAVRRIEAEELLLAFRVPGVVADAVIGPVPHACSNKCGRPGLGKVVW